MAYAQIDWHDFVVVETVDFQYGEIGNFPPPTTPDQVGVRTLMQERVDNGEETVEMSDAEDDMQVDSDDEMEKRINGRMYAPESELRVPGEEKSSRDNNQVIFKIYACLCTKIILILFNNLNKKKVQDMDESSSDEDGDLPPGVSRSDSRSNQMVQPAVPEKVIVKKGYNPKQSKI